MDTGRTRRTAWGALTLAVVVLQGCYTYVPIERPEVGTDVRVLVPVRSSVGSANGTTDMVPFEGTVVSYGDSLLLQTRMTLLGTGHREMVTMDTIRTDVTDLRNLEERVLSKGRTAAFTAAVVGGAVLGVMAISGLAGSDGGEKPDDGSQAAVRPDGFRPPGWRLFGVRIPIPWPSG